MPNTLDLESLLDAIKYAESRGSRDPDDEIGDRKKWGIPIIDDIRSFFKWDADPESSAYGAYQMRAPAFKDVMAKRPKALMGLKIDSVDDILGNEELQRSLAGAYLDILMHDYGMGTRDRTAAAYNTGAGFIKKHGITGKARSYLNTVNSYKPTRKP